MIFRFILAGLLSWACISGNCQNSPDTITSHTIGSRFITAINSDDTIVIEGIIKTVFHAKAHESPGFAKIKDLFQRLHANYSPLEFHHAEMVEFSMGDHTSYILHIYAKQSGAKMWQDFQMRLDPEIPHLITGIGFIAEVAEPISLPNGTIEQKETLAWLDKYIDKLATDNDFFGRIIIAKGDKILFEKSTGFTDPERKTKITSETLFNLGSGNKMFTALAIMQLEEQGKLSLTDNLLKYFPDFPDKARAAQTTLHHLLSHTSGLAEYWTSENADAMAAAADWHQILQLIYKDGFQFEPGSEAGYCNSNFMLLGRIIELASGQDYFDYIQANIYDKAGMTKSGTFENDSQTLPLARFLTRDDNNGWKIAKHGKKGSPAGGGYSNGTDILKFSKALKNNVLVSKATFENMTTDKTQGLKDAFPYGYGFILSRNAGPDAYGHGGIASGINFEFRYYPQLDIALVLFCNQDNGAYDDLKKNAIRLITGER